MVLSWIIPGDVVALLKSYLTIGLNLSMTCVVIAISYQYICYQQCPRDSVWWISKMVALQRIKEENLKVSRKVGMILFPHHWIAQCF